MLHIMFVGFEDGEKKTENQTFHNFVQMFA